MHYYHQQIEVFLDNDNNFLDFFGIENLKDMKI